MSYVIHLVVPHVSKDPREIWELYETLAQSEEDESKPAPVFVQLHETLTAVYPCLSQYPAGAPQVDTCPWSDGPLIRNFGSQTATLGLTGVDLEEVLAFLFESARVLGLTVLDPQSGGVHTPLWAHPSRTWRVLVRGLRRGFDQASVAAALARRSGLDQAETASAVAGGTWSVKRGMDRLSAIQFRAALRKLGCDATAELDPLPPRRLFLEIDLAGGNDKVALESLQNFAAGGHANHQYQLGYLLQHGVDLPQDEEAAARWYEKAAAQGDAQAQFALGLCYAEGVGVPKNDKLALEWLHKAADAGHADAQHWLGLMYGAPNSGPLRDEARAFSYFLKAAEQGLATAQFMLSVCCEHGQGTPPSETESVRWCEAAAQAGNPMAQLRLGERYADGQGVRRDAKRAGELFLAAAQYGYAPAQARLAAWLIIDGSGSPEENRRQAIEWAGKAAVQGDEAAATFLLKLGDSGDSNPRGLFDRLANLLTRRR